MLICSWEQSAMALVGVCLAVAAACSSPDGPEPATPAGSADTNAGTDPTALTDVGQEPSIDPSSDSTEDDWDVGSGSSGGSDAVVEGTDGIPDPQEADGGSSADGLDGTGGPGDVFPTDSSDGGPSADGMSQTDSTDGLDGTDGAPGTDATDGVGTDTGGATDGTGMGGTDTSATDDPCSPDSTGFSPYEELLVPAAMPENIPDTAPVSPEEFPEAYYGDTCHYEVLCGPHPECEEQLCLPLKQALSSLPYVVELGLCECDPLGLGPGPFVGAEGGCCYVVGGIACI